MMAPHRLLALVGLLIATAIKKEWTCSVEAREIVATREWQLIGENDTLPAGLHIRMDLSTGLKWAKLQDEEADNETTVVNVPFDGMEGEATTTEQNVVAATSLTAIPKSENDDATKDDQDYDFDMMHRTLSQLPPSEQERVGGIPQLPAGSTVASLSPRERELFETRMRQIWEQRQGELRTIEEEQVADLPEILKERIQSIRDYLQDPETHLQTLLLPPLRPPEDDESPQLDTIVDVLADLEYLLTDLDMARDFYTLGGWPLLSSLVSADVHSTGDDISLTSAMPKVVAHAAWAMGTAVKNTGEFTPWTVEKLWIGTKETSALQLLQQAFEASLDPSVHSLSFAPQLQQKLIYALGSVLRGNLRAQVQFVQHRGPSLLLRSLEQFQMCNKGLDGGDGSRTAHCGKMMQRVLSLASDMLLEAQQQSKEDGSTAAALDEIAQSFSATDEERWCSVVLTVLNDSAVPMSSAVSREVAFQAVHVFALHCAWDAPTQLQPALELLRKEWLRDRELYQDELMLLERMAAS